MPNADGPLPILDGALFAPEDAAALVTELSHLVSRLVAANIAFSQAVAGLGDFREPEALPLFADEWVLWAKASQAVVDGYIARTASLSGGSAAIGG